MRPLLEFSVFLSFLEDASYLEETVFLSFREDTSYLECSVFLSFLEDALLPLSLLETTVTTGSSF